MENKSSSKLVVLTFSILVLCFLTGFYIFAWTGPTAAPPSNNTSAPINVSAEAQTKQGNLTIGTATIKGDGSISTNLNSDKVDDLHAADLLAQSGGDGYKECYFIGEQNNVDCAAGYDTIISLKGKGCARTYAAGAGRYKCVKLGSAICFMADYYITSKETDSGAVQIQNERINILLADQLRSAAEAICWDATVHGRDVDSTVAVCCK